MTAAILEPARYAEVGPPIVVATVDQFNDIERLAWLEKSIADHERVRPGGPLEMLDLLVAGYEPDEHILWSRGNLMLNAGINRMGSLLIGGGGQAYDATHARIGAGNGSTAVAATDTDLSASAGSTNRWFQLVDGSFPTFATQVLTVKSTFASADGNFAWTEWGIDAGTASSNAVTAPLLNRKVPASSLGTKASGSSWAFTVTITFS